jgi:cell division protein FtsW
LAILLAFALVGCLCAVVISPARVRSLFGQYLGMGIALLIAMQALINVGVVTAWLPTKGLPLPFISFGGSNLVLNMVAVGLLYSTFTATAPSESGE